MPIPILVVQEVGSLARYAPPASDQQGSNGPLFRRPHLATPEFRGVHDTLRGSGGLAGFGRPVDQARPSERIGGFGRRQIDIMTFLILH